jgi:hypothetical protein
MLRISEDVTHQRKVEAELREKSVYLARSREKQCMLKCLTENAPVLMVPIHFFFNNSSVL